MNHFDSSILLWLNHFAGRFPTFEWGVQLLSNSEILKGQAFILILWWFWFAPEPEQRTRNREVIAVTLVGALVAIFLGRSLAMFLPFRIRPVYNPQLAFIASPGTHMGLRTWSAFPSDHAMLFAALATGIYFISPGVGIFTFIYALVLIDLPRVYLGLHHPTDIIVGVVLGTAVVWLMNTQHIRNRISYHAMEFLRTRERLFYLVFLSISVEILTMFNEPRELFTALVHLAQSVR